MSQKIKCPSCETEIEVTETMSIQIRKEVEQEMSLKLKVKSEELDKMKKEILDKESKFKEELETQVQEEKKKLWVVAQQKAKEQLDLELKDLKAQNEEKEKALQVALEKELEFRKKQRELEQKEKAMELELQRKLDSEKGKIEEEINKTAYEENRLKMMEKEKQLDLMRQQIEELKRKSEQGSMQIQGEVQEEDLKNLIASSFIFDRVEDVPVGVNGADLVQFVNSNSGKNVGIILWESKNTKSWQEKWISKLKDDQVKVKADVCILVSQVLPEGINSFGMINGVWVCDYKSVLALTQVIRLHLIQIAGVKNSIEGRDEKMAILYQYLSGSQFKSRVENIVSAFSSMKEDLDSEKRAMMRIWSKREKEIERVVLNTTGMYGDLQGIIGASLATVESLKIDFEEEKPSLI